MRGLANMRVERSPSMQAGFTMLEAIVALAIFAGGAMALYSLYAANITALTKAGDAFRQVPLVRQAVERLAVLNLTAEDAGEFEIDGLRFVWSARRLGPYREGQNETGLLGSFRVGLYEVEFTANDGGRVLGQYRLRLAGHELVRPLLEQDSF